MKIAVEGCAHGELEKIYDTLQHMEKQEGIKIDLLICCGDFQATRNEQDLNCMAIPKKYYDMCSFYKYYSGEKEAPILTIFIGGNHEASNYLQELGFGGWAAPNIYYLGYAGVVTIGGIRIAGLSGIYKGRDFMRGHHEKVPYTEETKRTVYHIRNLEVFRLKQLSQPIDIMLSHDWPRGVTDFGDKEKLLTKKPFFRKDIEENALGSKPAEELLHELKPAYWFAAHLHCKFPALIPHGPRKGATKFLALDKCLPRRKFLQVVDIKHDSSKSLKLSYDLEWLTILHLTNHLLSVKKGLVYMPGRSEQERWIFTPTEEEKSHVLKRFEGNLEIPENFTCTVTPFSQNSSNNGWGGGQLSAHLNPQTTLFCERLGIDDPLALLLDGVSQDTTPSSLSLPSFLTPDRTQDSSQVSFTGDEGSSLDGDSSQEDINSFTSSVSSRSSLPHKRISLSLPLPKLELPQSEEDGVDDFVPFSLDSQEASQELSTCSQDSEAINESQSEDSSKSTNKTQIEDSENARPMKKFKRRNQAMYSKEEED